MATFRSGFEQRVASSLTGEGVTYAYEDDVIRFVEPAKKRRYTPDFFLDNGVILEVKGRLTVADRKKHQWIKEQYPDLDLRFVFQRPEGKLYKGSKTSYSDWADKYDIPWCKGPSIPNSWTT
jgi:hypothetical protein|tara:strand:+ start:1244 stop:1609 length:366 start_codon:yes stop_codon:yes gene_type:complete